MAKILTVTRGLPSLVYPSVELSRRLAAAGHRVTFAGEPGVHALAAQHGLQFFPLEQDRFDGFLQADAAVSPLERILQLRDRRERALSALAVEGFAQAVRRDPPDLALVNGEMHEHIIAAAGAGVPVALLNSFVSIWRQPGLPPPHHVARPGVGWKGTQAGMSLLWQNLRVRKVRRRWFERVRRLGCDRVSVLRELSRTEGFDFAGEVDESQWLIPFTYRRLPVLSLHALEFEFPHRPPGHVHYVGPMILASRLGQPASDARPHPLAELIARRRTSNRTLIYAGFGSSLTTDLSFLRRLVGIVAERSTWDLVVSLSNRIPRSDLGPLPERVHVFPWVSQLDVLAHADVAITHGGINSVDECVMSGVPMLVYCGGETDMAGTTSRVVYHGIGIAGDPQRDDTAAIRAHVDRLLAEPAFRQRVHRLQRSYAAYVDDRVVERTVDALLAQDAPREAR